MLRRPLVFVRQHRATLFRSISNMSAPSADSAATTTPSSTPMEDKIRAKIQAALSPSTLIIRNDSHLHAHHAPMRGVTSKETHFNLTIVSSEFLSKSQPARHRMVYGLLKDEMAQEWGIHALQLKTKTPEEAAKNEQT